MRLLLRNLFLIFEVLLAMIRYALGGHTIVQFEAENRIFRDSQSYTNCKCHVLSTYYNYNDSLRELKYFAGDISIAFYPLPNDQEIESFTNILYDEK